jgi:hypothetical protein
MWETAGGSRYHAPIISQTIAETSFGPRHEMEAFGIQHLANSAAQIPPVFAENAGSDDKKITLLQPLFRPWNSHPLETVAFAFEKQPQKNRAKNTTVGFLSVPRSAIIAA